ncbi:MAG: TetR/AcrR family transcriptional regulator [Thiothrix sp.]|jgi:TetR/AcrR family transcriptional regulator|uniref:TetR/AcrR family transcriptional regulator n=1 Tax=Thiothrix sp. TaxID=1032 RepID=UPI00261D8B11|nr:TetR/AcrR family transcriptional regulator [Thiothrix sp.]MDD5395377.1 TetR/AcrR family transcriptional regulator [Thiothrix sp.]
MNTAVFPTRQPAEARQAAMVQAVLALAAQQEPASITTTDIAKAIGLSQGAVFRHFPNKQAIWQSVAEWLEATLLPLIQTAAQSSPDPLANLGNIFRAHLQFVQENPGVPRFIFHELQQPADSPVKQQVAGMLQRYGGILIGVLQQAKAQAVVVPNLDERSAATLFIGSLQGLVMQSMLAGSFASIQPVAEGVLVLYLRSIRKEVG